MPRHNPLKPLQPLTTHNAALSENLKPGKPLGVDILGTRVTLFRDQESGKVQCIDDTCPHRCAVG